MEEQQSPGCPQGSFLPEQTDCGPKVGMEVGCSENFACTVGTLVGSDFNSFVGANDPRGLEGIIDTDGANVGEAMFVDGATLGPDDGREPGVDDGILVGAKDGEDDSDEDGGSIRGKDIGEAVGGPAFEDGTDDIVKLVN